MSGINFSQSHIAVKPVKLGKLTASLVKASPTPVAVVHGAHSFAVTLAPAGLLGNYVVSSELAVNYAANSIAEASEWIRLCVQVEEEAAQPLQAAKTPGTLQPQALCAAQGFPTSCMNSRMG